MAAIFVEMVENMNMLYLFTYGLYIIPMNASLGSVLSASLIPSLYHVSWIPSYNAPADTTLVEPYM